MPTDRTDAQLREFLHDSRKVLRLGQLRDSEEWLSARLEEHGVAIDELRTVIYSDISKLDGEEAFYGYAVEKLTEMLQGDAEAAETFMVLDSLDCMADRVFENLHYQSMMKRNGTLHSEQGEKMGADLQSLRRNLGHCIAQLSGSSRVVVDTVLDGYIATVREELGLTAQRGRE